MKSAEKSSYGVVAPCKYVERGPRRDFSDKRRFFAESRFDDFPWKYKMYNVLKKSNKVKYPFGPSNIVSNSFEFTASRRKLQ